MPQPTLSRRSLLRGAGLAGVATVAAPLAAAAGADTAEAAGPGTRGVAVTTANVNMRAGAGTRHRVVRVLRKGTRVALDGRAVGRWQPVRVGRVRGWVSNRYLRRAGVTSSVAAPVAVAAPAAGYAGLPAATRFTAPTGLTSRGRTIAAELRREFPQVATMYGARSQRGSDHATGRAIDVMLPGDHRGAAQQALGQAIAEHLRANAGRLGVTYVIWDQRIWNIARDAEGWRGQSDRGSDNANHRNHVHVSFR